MSNYTHDEGGAWARSLRYLALSLALVVASPVAAMVEFLPQGRVSGVEAIQVNFSRPVVAFGDFDASGPILLECKGPAPEGRGRWLDDTRWVYQFASAVPAGVRCLARVSPEFRDLQGQALAADQVYEFDTGAPRVTDIRPYPSSTIDEQQIFILRFDSPVNPLDIAQNSHCVVHGLAEKIPAHAVVSEDEQALLEAAYMPIPESEDYSVLLQCARVLPSDAEIKLVVGSGLRAVQQPTELASSQTPQIWEYGVRPPFQATVSCTRERAGRPCLPMTPITVEFAAPVVRAALDGVRLETGDRVFEAQPSRAGDEEFTSYLKFPGPFPAASRLMLSLPDNLQDDAGRPLENAERYPLEIEVADYPPLAKFASGSFGLVERFAQGQPSIEGEHAALPITLRHVEADVDARGLSWSAGQLANLRSIEDAEVLAWYSRLRRLDAGRWSPEQVQDIMAGRKPRPANTNWESLLDARGISLLKNQKSATSLTLPSSPEGQWRPFEVIGVPLTEPGFHVLEIESPRLGASLLENEGPMYVRTGVLLTNLAVHVKQGRDDLFVWVTTLSDARPVSDAEVSVLDCKGGLLLKGRTDAQGVWHHRDAVDAPPYCPETELEGLFVSAHIGDQHPLAYGKADYSFVMSAWDRGIEAWRFNLPTDFGPETTLLTHTVFDRSLYRAGERVSMKHFLREEARDGLQSPNSKRPQRLLIEHQGSSQLHELELQWESTPTGGLMALSEFDIPASAHLGSYSVRMTDDDQSWYGATQFRVEEFRLPVLSGQLSVRETARSPVLIAPASLKLDMQLSWLTGGPAMGQEVELSAVAQDQVVSFPHYEEYSFRAPDEWAGGSAPGPVAHTWETGAARKELFVDGRRLKLDKHGMATVDVDNIPAVDRPQRLVFEAAFADPNGEIQTLSQSVNVWPSEVQLGIRAPGWERTGKQIPISVVALGADAQPREGVEIQLLAVERKVYTVRKRMVGGFYRYDSHTQFGQAEHLCKGTTNADGLLQCEVSLDTEGSFELVVQAEDAQQHLTRSYSTIWLSGSADLWFDAADDDRIDLIPAKREWSVGEQAQFQVRMPFRQALALVSVEREGVLWSQVVELEGSNPVVSIPVAAEWGPNAYVSVLVLRGRLYALPWQSFFAGGWRDPGSWLQEWKQSHDGSQVSSLIDLAKPAFRFGLAELKLSTQANRLKVELRPEKANVQVREETRARIKVSLPDGKPAAHATVTFVAVDEALLELAANDSWSLYEAMHPRRSLGVRTASNQMEVVGRRHYGRKAVAAGGGGGHLPTRQLFDTLLSWQPNVQLEANGEAVVRFRMNDTLSRFRLVVLADYQSNYFGSTEVSVVSSQDIQLVSGLPPVVREGDRYLAQVTVRNGSDRRRLIKLGGRQGQGQAHLAERELDLAPGQAATAAWDVAAPILPWPDEHLNLAWYFSASDGSAGDALTVIQTVEPRVPATTVQASVVELPANRLVELPVAPPVKALRATDGAPYGGLLLDVSSSLIGSMEGVRDWWRNYPYTCLEQSASQAIALDDPQRWQKVLGRLATHMDEDGLLRYFPGVGPGSDVLTAYLVSVGDEAKRLGWELDIPGTVLQRMLDGLQSFAQGRIRRDLPWPTTTLDARRIMAMEALSRHGRVTPEMLSTLGSTPEQWPTPTIVDWLSILMRMPDKHAWQTQTAQARSLLQARMSVSGTTLRFSDAPQNSAPGLMATPVTSLARMLTLGMEDPQWQADLPRMVKGLLSQQHQGAWSITTENVWGTLALQAYAKHFESRPVAGTVWVKGARKGSLKGSLKGSDPYLLKGSDPDLDPVLLNLDSAGATGRLNWEVAGDSLRLLHQGQGTAWLSLRAQLRLADESVQQTGFRLERRVIPVQRQDPNAWSRGDIYRVELDIYSRESGSWVVLNDPIPASATILGSGLGRDSTNFDSNGPTSGYAPAFVERTATAYRAYFDYMPAGKISVSYTLRLNAIGDFALPATRVEGLYQPDLRGSFTNANVVVGQGALDHDTPTR